MNHPHETKELDDALGRAGDYLMRRAAEYRETPIVVSAGAPPARRGKRLLVGSAAVATLCVTALAGSFIGGTSPGEVEVAEAAWNAVPAAPTEEQVRSVQLECGITASQLATIENVPPASIPEYMLEPALVDVRGTTTTAVYFTWSAATLCVQFGDGSVYLPQIPMAISDEFAWQEPTAHDLSQDTSATMIVGVLPPNTTETDPNATRESEAISDSQWEAYVEGPGIERTTASINGVMGRYVAWVPVTGDFSVAFVNVVTGEERVVEVLTGISPRLTPQTTIVWPATPVTTVPAPPNG
jgi:hypothetical protein